MCKSGLAPPTIYPNVPNLTLGSRTLNLGRSDFRCLEFLSLRITLAPPGPPTLTLDRARAACEIAAQAHPSLPPPPQLRLRTELQIENEIEIELEIEKGRSTRSWCILCKAVPRTMKYEDQQRYMS